MSKKKITYHIYGRTDYPHPLAFVTAVTIDAAEKPAIPAGSQWLEVITFPETAIIHVIPRRKRESP